MPNQEIMQVAAFTNFQLADSTFEFKIKDITILTGKEELSRKVFNEYFLKQAGNFAMVSFTNFAYAFRPIQTTSPANFDALSRDFCAELNSFVGTLWYAKDCNTSLHKAYCYDRGKPNFMVTEYALYSDASGNDTIGIFTKEEIESCLKIHEKLEKIIPDAQVTPPLIEPSPLMKTSNSNYYYINQSETIRIQRAMSFVDMARTTTFLPLKIALNCSALESLFTSSGTEISYRVSERTALYLGGTYDEKVQNFKFVKDEAYDIRSKFFHGDTPTKKVGKLDNLKEVSIKLDALLRTVMTKAVMEDSEIFSQKDMSEYFKQMVFGDRK